VLFKLFGMSESRPRILEQAVRDFLSMLDHCHWMYGHAGEALWGKTDVEAVRAEIYQRDIQVNKAERAVRKAIVSHLSMNPKQDMNLCLILMSVVKDAERVGDYCKNMMDLPDYHPLGSDANDVTAELKRIQMVVEGLFPTVLAAFREEDEAAGAVLVRQEREVTSACEDVIEQVLKSPGLSNRQAVTYTLLARFHKRVAAHLGNIASSLVMPIHKLDYFDEQYLPGQRSAPDEE
jgi:phosphate uptake regulator